MEVADSFLAPMDRLSAASTNTIDALAFRDLAAGGSPGQDPTIMVTIGTAFAGGTSLQVVSQGSVDGVTWTNMDMTDAIPVASLVAGGVIKLPLGHQQLQSAGIPRYYRLNYVIVGTMSAGTVTSDLVMVAPQEMPIGPTGKASGYPGGFVVNN
jgi:hypothetical protein